MPMRWFLLLTFRRPKMLPKAAWRYLLAVDIARILSVLMRLTNWYSRFLEDDWFRCSRWAFCLLQEKAKGPSTANVEVAEERVPIKKQATPVVGRVRAHALQVW